MQLGQIDLLFNEKPQGNLPSTSKVNLRRWKEHCKAITLRSRKTVETIIHAHKDKENLVEENDKDAEISVQDAKYNDETIRNAEKPLQNLVESMPNKVKEYFMEKKPIVPYP